MIPREQQKQRLVIRPAQHNRTEQNTHFNARQTINSILHTNRFLFGWRSEPYAGKWELLLSLCVCMSVGVVLRWIFTHIKFNLTGSVKWHWQSKKATRENCQAQESNLLQVSRKIYSFVSIFSRIRSSCALRLSFLLSWVELSYELKWRTMGNGR